MTYNQLRSTSFHLNLDALEPVTYHTLRYPKEWRKPLLDLFQSRKPNLDKYQKIPIRALNDAIALLAPDLIRPEPFSREGNNTAWNGEDWLHATSPIPTDGIARIIRAWIHTLGKQKEQTAADYRLLSDALAAVQPGAPGWDGFTWEERTLDIAAEAAKTGVNGTARPDGLLYSLLPHLLIGALTSPGVTWPYGEGEPIEFRRSVAGSGAEAVSWPPAHKDLPFSFKMALQVQNVPGRPDPTIYADFGIRRWVYSRARLPRSSDSNVYLVRSHPLLDSTGRSRAFRRIGIRWHNGRGIDWSSRLQAVLDELDLRPALPDPTDLAHDPRAHLDRSTRADGIAIVFRNKLGTHKVEPGLSVRDRRELFDWTSHVLERWIQPDEPFTRVFAPNAIAASPRKDRNALDRAQKKQIREAAELAGTGPTSILETLPSKYAPRVQAGLAALIDRQRDDHTLTIEVHHFEDSALPSLVTDVIACDLGSPTTTTAETTWQVGNGAVHLTTQTIRGQHADKIPIPKKAKRPAIESALLKRVTEVQETLTAANNPQAASIVEVHRRDYFKERPLGDVKPAFRLAHAKTGRITQFVHPPTGEPNDRERITRVWRDLLRQLGVQLAPAQVKIRNLTLPEPTYYVAIWVVRLNKTQRRSHGRRVPVMVYLDSSRKQHPQLISPYFNDWMDYHQGLTKLALDGRFRTETRTADNQDVVHKFITDRLRDVTALRRDTLLLTDTRNLRLDWPFIGNGKLMFDRLDDHVVSGTGLRHVRIRDDCGQLEVPDVWGIGTDEKNAWGLSGGLWHMHGDRVFASTTDKPVQARNAVHRRSKVVRQTHTPRPKDGEAAQEVTRPAAPTAEVWNSRMLELTVAAIQPGDDPRAWAAIAHELRWANLQYDDATTLPMPLHLAQLAQEYVLGTQTEEAEDDREDVV